MSKVFDFYLQFASDTIKAYQSRKGDYLPLASYLKEYFKKFPKAGSRDRKTVSQLVFNYYRTGNLFIGHPLEKQIIFSNYICENQLTPLLTYHLQKINPELLNQTEKKPTDKIAHLQSLGFDVALQNIFPFTDHLSNLKNKEEFIESFCYKPNTFIRVRKGKEEDVRFELNSNQIQFTIDSELPQCFIIENQASLTELITFNKGFFEIQDRSSQQVLKNVEVTTESFWWDACCASGGKSLLLLEHNKNIRIFATDVRQSIVDNYKKRISKTGFGNHETQVCDLTQALNTHYTFDGIICDVPCSGSGTWARTPEQLSLFNTEQIMKYAETQKKIVSNCISRLRKGGQLVYITCSVFKEENEEVVHHILKSSWLKLIEQTIIEGAHHKADTMFVAIFNSI